MNSIIERLVSQLLQERDDIDAAILRLQGEKDSVPEKPKRSFLRKGGPSVVTAATGVPTVQDIVTKTPCVHGCGKVFGDSPMGNAWRRKHEADCAFVVPINSSATVGRRVI